MDLNVSGALVVFALVLLSLGVAVGWLLAQAVGARPVRTPTLPPPDNGVADGLAALQHQLLSIEHERSEAYGDLRAQVRAMGVDSAGLRHETAALVTALRSPIVRGRWGEMQLRRIVEAAGMVKHCDFLEQPTSSTDDGVRRPDLVVTLTGGRQIVVDAKVPFAGYIEALEAPDEVTARLRLKAHARHLRGHIDTLAGRDYARLFSPSPEFVVLFVPSDPFLQAALEHDPALLEYAFDHDVVVAGPSTLVALLRTVAYTWRQEAVAESAQQVLDLGRELHGRLGTLGAHLTKLGTALNSAVGRYNETVGSLERSVLVSARRFTDLGVSTSGLPGPPPVELTPRTVCAPELTEREDSLGHFPPRAASA